VGRRDIKRSVSLGTEVYDALRAKCHRSGSSMRRLTEDLLTKAMSGELPYEWPPGVEYVPQGAAAKVDAPPPKRKLSTVEMSAPVFPPGTFCAWCTKSVEGQPVYTEPSDDGKAKLVVGLCCREGEIPDRGARGRVRRSDREVAS
jgi:hypothetical protein